MSFLKSCVESVLHGLIPPLILGNGFLALHNVFQTTADKVRECLSVFFCTAQETSLKGK